MGNTLFLVMGFLHWIAVIILWKMTRPENPEKQLKKQSKTA